jgi:hypothetical protein
MVRDGGARSVPLPGDSLGHGIRQAKRNEGDGFVLIPVRSIRRVDRQFRFAVQTMSRPGCSNLRVERLCAAFTARRAVRRKVAVFHGLELISLTVHSATSGAPGSIVS